MESETTIQTLHTPGPWIYKATAGNHDFSVYPESTGRDVAFVRDFNEANARLISAAPDLLVACELAIAQINELLRADNPANCEENARATLRQLCAATARAER